LKKGEWMPVSLICVGFVVMILALPVFESLLVFVFGSVLLILGLIWGGLAYDWELHYIG